jgi:hypothetical protein
MAVLAMVVVVMGVIVAHERCCLSRRCKITVYA